MAVKKIPQRIPSLVVVAMQQGALFPGGEINSRAQGLPALASICTSFFIVLTISMRFRP
jgi:hypothetical protein